MGLKDKDDQSGCSLVLGQEQELGKCLINCLYHITSLSSQQKHVLGKGTNGSVEGVAGGSWVTRFENVMKYLQFMSIYMSGWLFLPE